MRRGERAGHDLGVGNFQAVALTAASAERARDGRQVEGIIGAGAFRLSAREIRQIEVVAAEPTKVY